MPTYYLHAVLGYREISKHIVTTAPRSAFILGTIAPDAVPFGETKRRSHYNLHIGLTIGYRMDAFEREFASYRRQSDSHLWFYKGYKYHLNLDQIWFKTCLNRAMIRLAVNKIIGRGKRLKPEYYKEMEDYDSFHRSDVTVEFQNKYIEELIHSDRRLLPPFLSNERLDKIIEYLEETKYAQHAKFQGELLRHKNIRQFFKQAEFVTINVQTAT